MDAVEELKNNLKDIPVQWLIRGDHTSVSFDGELKDISYDNFFGALSIKINGPRKSKYAKNLRIKIDEPFNLRKENDEIKLRYTIFSNEKPILIAGYVKGQPNEIG